MLRSTRPLLGAIGTEFHIRFSNIRYSVSHERDPGRPFHGVLARHLGVEDVSLDFCRHDRLERCVARDQQARVAKFRSSGRTVRRILISDH